MRDSLDFHAYHKTWNGNCVYVYFRTYVRVNIPHTFVYVCVWVENNIFTKDKTSVLETPLTSEQIKFVEAFVATTTAYDRTDIMCYLFVIK